eukprot:NODE_59_length_25653_cov_0.289622.p17 type:complete len:105 gc:universal NODE_59_length_25653_cov_0.289622:14384-14070(-)
MYSPVIMFISTTFPDWHPIKINSSFFKYAQVQLSCKLICRNSSPFLCQNVILLSKVIKHPGRFTTDLMLLSPKNTCLRVKLLRSQIIHEQSSLADMQRPFSISN